MFFKAIQWLLWKRILLIFLVLTFLFTGLTYVYIGLNEELRNTFFTYPEEDYQLLEEEAWELANNWAIANKNFPNSSYQKTFYSDKGNITVSLKISTNTNNTLDIYISRDSSCIEYTIIRDIIGFIFIYAVVSAILLGIILIIIWILHFITWIYSKLVTKK